MVNFKWDWNRALEVRAEEAAEEATKEATEAKTIKVVINMLKEREPYERISRLVDTPLENVMEIAKRNNLAYN